MKRKRIFTILVLVLLTCALSTTAFAIDESEVESAIAASSQEEVAGNIFIWFLCAIGFLKVSQKIDSFMASLGVNVGRTGGSMLAELMVAGRGIATAAGAFGSTVSNRHSSHGTHNGGQAAGAAFTGGGNGLVGVTKRAVGNAAASSATGTGSGLSSIIGGAMFASSLASGGKFATSVIGAVAKGDMSSVGSITGEQASEALMDTQPRVTRQIQRKDVIIAIFRQRLTQQLVKLDAAPSTVNAAKAPPLQLGTKFRIGRQYVFCTANLVVEKSDGGKIGFDRARRFAVFL